MKRRDVLKAAGLGIAGSATLAMPAIAQSHAGAEMALHVALPEGARHDLRRRRDLRQIRLGGDGRATVPIQDFAAGEIVPGLAGGRRGGGRHRRDLPHRELLLLGQGSDLRLRHRRAVRPQQPRR